MKKIILVLFSIILLFFLGIFVYFYYFFNLLGECESVLISQINNTEKNISAQLYEIGCGATSDSFDEITLSDNSGKLEKIYTSRHRPIVSMEWISSNELRINSAFKLSESIKKNSFGVEVMWVDISED